MSLFIKVRVSLGSYNTIRNSVGKMIENWSNLLESLTSDLRPFISEFSPDDPIGFCWKKRSELKDYVTKHKYKGEVKSDVRAWTYKEEGDENLRSERYVESLQSYTNCIFYLEHESPVMPLVYARRASVLKILGHYKQSIHDTEMALSLGHPDKALLLSEKSMCQALLKENVEQMNLNFHGAHSNINNIQNEICDDRAQISHIQASIKNLEVHQREDIKQEIPKLKFGENQNLPSSSNCLELQYNEEKGRHIVAKHDIHVGDVLFVEKPFSFIVVEPYCAACCRYAIAPIPCNYCLDVQFCSEKCRRNGYNSFHKFECGYVHLIIQTGIGHLALRVVEQSSEESPTSQFNTFQNKVLRYSRISNQHGRQSVQFSEERYQNVYFLQTHAASMSIKDLLQYSLTALLLSTILLEKEIFGHPTDLNLEFCANVILRHITQLVSNAHSISSYKSTLYKEDSLVTLEQEEQIGSAIYPSVSMMNHSCEPSIINYFNKNILIVRACKDIKKGEEVYNSYGVHCKRMKRIERQKLLRSQYFFDCRCPPCSNSYDRYEVLNSLKCENCNGPMVKEDKHDNKEILVCLSCGSKDADSVLKSVLEAEIGKIINEGEHALHALENYARALHFYINAWKLGRKVLYKFHKDLSYSANQIAQCLFCIGDIKKCLMFLGCSILSIKGRFGHLSSEFAFEAKKYSDIINLYYNTSSGKDSNELQDFRSTGLMYYETAEKILKLLYGEDHPIVLEIEKNKQSLM